MTQMFSVPGQRGTLQSRVEAGHSLRILLVDDTYAYSDTHVEVSDVTAWEISGGGYARFVLTGVSWDTTGAVPALLGDDAAVAGSSGSASTAYVFDNTDEELLLRVVFDSPVALSGELPIEWPGGRLATYDDATDDIDALDARVDALEVGAVLEVQAGDNVTVDSTDPQRPIVSATGGGGGGLPSGGSVGQTIANTGSGTGAWTDLADVPIDGTPLGEGLDYLADELAKVADPTWLRPVDVVATSNVDVSSPGTIDGEVSYRYALLTAQTDPAENLVWDSSGLGVPMVPSPIHPSGAQIQTATTVVNLGTHAGETWRITSGSAGTDSAIWGQVTGGSGPDLSNADPLGPGTTDPGTSPDASRDDHVHPRQTGIVNSEIDAAAAIAQSKISGLTTDLAGKVPTTRTVNGHALSSNVTVTASDDEPPVSADEQELVEQASEAAGLAQGAARAGLLVDLEPGHHEERVAPRGQELREELGGPAGVARAGEADRAGVADHALDAVGEPVQVDEHVQRAAGVPAGGRQRRGAGSGRVGEGRGVEGGQHVQRPARGLLVAPEASAQRVDGVDGREREGPGGGAAHGARVGGPASGGPGTGTGAAAQSGPGCQVRTGGPGHAAPPSAGSERPRSSGAITRQRPTSKIPQGPSGAPRRATLRWCTSASSSPRSIAAPRPRPTPGAKPSAAMARAMTRQAPRQ